MAHWSHGWKKQSRAQVVEYDVWIELDGDLE